jgi:hypothetical protein
MHDTGKHAVDVADLMAQLRHTQDGVDSEAGADGDAAGYDKQLLSPLPGHAAQAAVLAMAERLTLEARGMRHSTAETDEGAVELEWTPGRHMLMAHHIGGGGSPGGPNGGAYLQNVSTLAGSDSSAAPSHGGPQAQLRQRPTGPAHQLFSAELQLGRAHDVGGRAGGAKLLWSFARCDPGAKAFRNFGRVEVRLIDVIGLDLRGDTLTVELARAPIGGIFAGHIFPGHGRPETRVEYEPSHGRPETRVEYDPRPVDLTGGEAARCRFHTLRFATARQAVIFADHLGALSEPHGRMLQQGLSYPLGLQGSSGPASRGRVCH